MRFEVQPNDISVTRGRTIVLNCTIADRVGMVQWTQNGVALGADRPLPGYPRYSMIGVETQLSSQRTVGEWNLQIVDVELEDDGEYQCQAGATATVSGIRSRSAHVTVVSNHPRPEEKFVDTVGMVTVNASKADSGRRIECRAINEFMAQPYSAFATLDVQYAPEITMGINLTRTIREYDFVRFQCTGIANPADIQWRWYRNNQQIEGQTTNTLIIHQISHDYDGDTISCKETVNKASFGVYVCTASSSGFPDASKEALLLQNGKPSIRSEKEQFATVGEKGKLECIVHSVPKPDRMVWLRDGRPIDYAGSGRFSYEQKDLLYGRTNILHILKVQEEDFGKYNCNVVNAYGSDNATITLVEKTVPPLPYIIGGAVGGVAVLFIIALACVLYQRYKREDSGSVLGSTTDTDSSADKKRKDADSPSTLMDQWRQDYNKKDFYRYSADYDELNYKDHTGNNNAYGCLEPVEPYRETNTFTEDYIPRAMTPLERYEAVYGPSQYSMSSFRGRDYAGLDVGNAKLATDV
nr:hypothetical protein BaRGS_010327 [Batillaria attramentaria]